MNDSTNNNQNRPVAPRWINRPTVSLDKPRLISHATGMGIVASNWTGLARPPRSRW